MKATKQEFTSKTSDAKSWQ